VPSAFALNTSSSDDSTMRPLREATSIGIPLATGSRESTGDLVGSDAASVVGGRVGDPAPAEGDDVVHDIAAEAQNATRATTHRRCRWPMGHPPARHSWVHLGEALGSGRRTVGDSRPPTVAGFHG
jgi:hypothetical protein